MMRLSSGLRRFRWPVFAGWLLALIPALYLVLTQSGHLTGGGFEVPHSQSLRVHDALEAHYPDQGASPLALVAAPRADATYEDMNAAAGFLQQVAKQQPDVVVVPNAAQPSPQPDRPYVVSLRLDGATNNSASDAAKKLRVKVGVQGEHPGQMRDGRVRLYVIGQGALSTAAAANTKHDIAKAEQWNLPIILIVLLAVFGSLAAAAIPLMLGIVTVIITMGLVYLLSAYTAMSVFVTSTVSMFGIALAVDYSLFILMRFREELRAGRQPQEAIDAAMATSGLAVALSGMTVVASLTGIYLINTPALTSMATGAILAVAVAMLTSTTMTPAVLATFGRSAAKRSAALHWSRRPETTQSRFWTHWIGGVMRRPWGSAAAASIVLLAMAVPALSMVLGNSLLRQFNSSHEIRAGVSAASEALGPGALGPVQVLVTFPDGDASSATHTQTIAAIRQEISRSPNIVSVAQPVFADNNSSAMMSAMLSVDPEDLGARNTISWMRGHLPAAATGSAEVSVGGPTALIKDFDDQVSKTQWLVLVFVALIAFVMLLLSIQSIFLALKGVVMTMLSVAAAYGSLVVVFQWGWLEKLGFLPITSIDSTVPPLVLAMTFGLSMDYEIFLLTRIRERFLQTGNTHDAVAYGVSTSARTITSAALIMIAVFIGFAFAGMPLVAEIGVACAVAIAVDATVVRLVMVPALMAVFAEWNWWLPAWLERILPSVDFEKPLPAVDLGDVVDDPRQHLGARGAQCRPADRAQVGGPVEDPGTRRDHRRRPAGLHRLRTQQRTGEGQGQHLRRQHRHPSTGRDRHPERRQRRHRTVGGAQARRQPLAPRWCQPPGTPRNPARPPRNAVAGTARGRAGRAGRATCRRRGSRAPGIRAPQPGGDHQRPAADRRQAADPDRRRDAPAQGLPDHEPQQQPGLHGLRRTRRHHGRRERRRRSGRYGQVLLWSITQAAVDREPVGPAPR